ncbi:MAG TPA: efflux RND transporter periplasmic adaptor subunit [Gemmatimonadaceae bacterium]|nr:efflux RND transporter periplasmic adaptor subunit [Gemmatimonadaceae bacterium]
MLKRLIKTKWFLASAFLLVVGVPAYLVLGASTGSGADALTAPVKRGDFKIVVTASGELRAPKSVTITGPQNMTQAEIYNGVKILSMVTEGTTVKAGDVVAELDRSPAASKLADVNLALQKAQAQYEQASLDSALNLSKAREDMRTQVLTLEEKRLAKEQSKYEAPSVQRQTEIDYERAMRALKQDSSDLVTKTEQAKAKMREVGTDFERQKNKLKIVQDIMGAFTIKAPSDGMVIYIKDWNGKKRAVGSQVSPWDPGVATLPDMSTMESVTYVNEIDVRKLSVGQPVEISLDADPSKKLAGKVTAVANVGEQRPNSDAKVFEVKVEVVKPDTTLRPGMTTGNAIVTFTQPDVLHIPLEALGNENGVPFVYRRQGSRVTKQEVETGAINDDEAVITRGLDEGDRVMLTPPADRATMTLERLPNSRAGIKAPGGDSAGRQTVPVTPPGAAKDGKGAPKPGGSSAPKAPARPDAAAPTTQG